MSAPENDDIFAGLTPPPDKPYGEQTEAEREERRAYLLGYCRAIWGAVCKTRGQEDGRFHIEWRRSSREPVSPDPLAVGKRVILWAGYIFEPAVGPDTLVIALHQGGVETPAPYAPEDQDTINLFTPQELTAILQGMVLDGEFHFGFNNPAANTATSPITLPPQPPAQ